MKGPLASVLCFLLFAFDIQALELSLGFHTPTSPGQQNLCGILTCEGSFSDGFSNATTNDSTGPSITVLTVYKSIQSNLKDGNGSGRREVEIATLTLAEPKLTRVSNGFKVNGELGSERATLTLGVVKEKDCSAQYSCQVRTSDGDVQTNHLGQSSVQPVKQPDIGASTSELLLQQMISLQQEQLALLTSAVGSWDSKFAALETRLDALQDRVEENIMSVHDQIEAQVVDKLDLLENKVKEVCTDGKNVSATLSEIQDGLTNLNEEFYHEDKRCSDMNALAVSNNTLDIVTAVKTRMDELLIWEQRNHFKLDHLVKVNERAANWSESLSDDLHTNFVTLTNNLEQLKKGVENCSTETVTSMNDLTDAHNNASTLNRTKPTTSTTGDKPMQSECIKGMGNPPQDSAVHGHYGIIDPNPMSGLNVSYLCDSETDGGGWIVIQRRSSGLTDFYKGWDQYKYGFGSLYDEFWLGNENIHALTSSNRWELRIDLQYGGQSKFAHYSTFSVEDENSDFVLRLGKYDGTAGDSLDYHNNQRFATYDRDHNTYPGNQPEKFGGGWWYRSGYTSNLNGKWNSLVVRESATWWGFSGDDPVTFSEMKIRKL